MSTIEDRIEESYQHIQPYLKNEDSTKELREMCRNCEAYCGAEHDFTQCRDKRCFQFWLCYKYMTWSMSFGW